MKFFKNSLPIVCATTEDYEVSPKELFSYFIKHNNPIYFNISYSNEDLSNQKEIFIRNKLYYINLVKKKKSKEIFSNKNVCRNKIVNYTMLQGKKLTSYRLYNDTFNLFYFFFEKFNQELSSNYNLYNTYYSFSLKNRYTFFEPVFIFRNLVSFLQPSYIISFKKSIKKKKSKKLNKEIMVKYIRPLSRINFALKSIIRFTNSFVFEKKYESVAYTLIYLFLSNKNSTLYKKKVMAYERLIKLKKVK